MADTPTAQPPIIGDNSTTAPAPQQPANGPGAAGAPTSYKDATYDQLDAATAKQTGIPAWLLPAIRTQGEKSNNDQVSTAGAQTVYQITPATRQLAIKAYGIDPYLSASNASLVAGKLLSDSMQRNNGSVPQAIGEYIGGTNRDNWGSTTNAYIKRVLQGAGGQVQPADGANSNPYAAASAQANATAQGVGTALQTGVNANNANLPKGPSIAKLVDAYNSGAMDPQAAQDFQNDVQNGKVFLPNGVQLNAPQANGQQGLNANPEVVPISGAEAASAQAQQAAQPAAAVPAQTNPTAQQPPPVAPQPVPLKVVQAYQSGQMDPQAKAEFEADIKAGKITLPQPQTPQEQGFLSQIGTQLGLTARDLIQGVGGTIGLGYDPIAATLNAATGSHINTAHSAAVQLADKLGLPQQPTNGVGGVVNQAAEAGFGALGFAGGANALAGGTEAALGRAAAEQGTQGAEAAAQRAATAQSTQPAAGGVSGAAQSAAEALGTQPAAQTIASAAGGGAGQQVKEAGGGALAQTAANIGAAMVSPARVGNLLKNGAELVGQRVAPGLTAKIAGIAADDQQPLRQAAADVAQSIQNTPKDVAFDPATGEITKEGRELSILSGLTPDGLKKAYGNLETAAAGNVQNAATENAKQFGIDYTQGQAEQNFAKQDKEQTLVKAATPEGDQARAWFDQQQQQINNAVTQFQAGFGGTAATASERGAQVQDAARALREQGQAGVRTLYEQAAALPGEAVPLETQPIIDAAATAITARPTEPAIKEQIASTLAKYGLLGGEVTEKGPFGNTVTANGKGYQITGDVTPLSLQNAEAMRQQLNRVYGADKTGHTGGVIAALDDSIENAVTTVAQRGETAAPEVGQQMTHTPSPTAGLDVPAANEQGVVTAPDGGQVRIGVQDGESNVLDPLKDAGALTYEKATPDGQVTDMAVRKDGKLVPASKLMEKDGTSNGKAWIPPTPEAAETAQDLLRAHAGAPDAATRKDIAARLQAHVKGEGSTQVQYAGPGEQPGTSRVSVQPAAAPTPEALTAQNSALTAERDQLAAQRAQTGAAATPAEKALTAASGSASAKDRATALKWAQDNSRPDVARAVLSNARADAEAAANGAQPKNPAMMAVQQKAAAQLEKSAADLHAAAGEPYGAATEKVVPTQELTGGSQAGAERQAAFEQARVAARQQKQTYEAKDVIQDLTDFKNGTNTPKVLPENTFAPLFNNPTNLRKAKAVLLADDAGGTGAQGWKAVQGQALAHIAEAARNPQTGDISPARLNSAIGKFGDEQLKILFEPADYNRLKSLQAAIGRTAPLSGTVNYSNTFSKLYNLFASHLSDSIAAAGASVGGAPGALAGKALGVIAEKVSAQRKAASAIKSLTNTSAPTAKAAQAAADKANRDLIDTLIDASKRNAFVPYGITGSTSDQKGS